MPDDPAFLLHVAVIDLIMALGEVERRAGAVPREVLVQEQPGLREAAQRAVALHVRTLDAEHITLPGVAA